MTTRTRGVTVRKISSPRLAAAVASISGLRPAQHRLSIMYLLDRGEGPGARYATILAEGVGDEVSPDGTLPVWTMDVGAIYEVPVEAIVEAAAEDYEEVDLADAIRVFGARLDANHRIWTEWSRRG